MKKLLIALLTVFMVFGLVACGDSGSKLVTTYTYVYDEDIDNMDYVVTNKANDHEINVNLVEGLLENDSKGAYIGAVAESWESNSDASEWTFHLRKGVQWVTAEGEVYAETTAQDFLTGLQHAADFDSQTMTVVDPFIAKLADYENGLCSFDEVGVKATDDYTLVYTLTGSCPYFYTLFTYTIMYPVNKEFLESKGTGCKLGAPDVNNCSFGSGTVDSILYNGPYILTTNDAKSKQVLTKNANYWDKGNVFLDTITLIYDDGSDSYSVIKGFENGTYSLSALNAAWTDYNDYKTKYEGKVTVSMSNSYAFGMNLNLNRLKYSEGWTTAEKLANANGERENTTKAVRNANFRNALLSALDRVAYLTQSMTTEVATATLRNFDGVPELVSTSDGKTYGSLVTAAYDKLTGTDISLADGQDPFLSKEKALAYIEAAKAEGVVFPVTLDMPYIGDGSDIYKNRAASMVKSISDNTDGQIIINAISKPREDVMNTCFYNEDAATCDYDINTAGGWGPDFSDPKTFADIYSCKNGYYMTVLGLYGQETAEYAMQSDAVKASNDAAITESGLAEYTAMIEAADAITDDMDKRYEAYAEADAYLVAKAIFIPMQMQTRGERVSKVVPFTRAYSVAGTGEYKYKFMKVQEDIVTEEQYNTAYAAWSK